MLHFIISTVLVLTTLYLLKNIQVAKRYTDYKLEYINRKVRIWEFIAVIIIGFSPVFNVIVFTGFLTLYIMLIDDTYRRLNPDCSINKLLKAITSLKRILNKELF